ncbi:hypothetical protein EDC56_2848 [Sinobacterium caligoides]|uniref:Uncharacterized protein n=1 Tax=Sinobacterium caligoides TaxID=933926 RepID=A0A3N2DK80_9GAMM|nr:hypothetical protein [Sinobacterium caligoides]ROS00210.1 hypothetical protein EDC56_2848 [Sinobacterium caligoides]
MADSTKYLFNGNSYGKGRLVHAVAQHIMVQQDVNYSELKALFGEIENVRDLMIDQAEEKLQRHPQKYQKYQATHIKLTSPQSSSRVE